jgi:hypothetical protein
MPSESIPITDFRDEPQKHRPDPMTELFGPGSGTRLIGNPDDDVPEDVMRILDENKLSTQPFQATLKSCPEGDEPNEIQATYLKTWNRKIPSTEWIAQTYGPGNYYLVMKWQGYKDGDNKKSWLAESILISISEKILEEYKANQIKRKVANVISTRDKVTQTMLEQKIENEAYKGILGEPEKPQLDPVEAGKKFVEQIREGAALLGMNTGQQQQQQVAKAEPFPWDKIMAAIAPIAAALITSSMQSRQARDDNFNKMMMLMMTQGSKSTEQMMSMMQMSQGVGSGNMAIKEFKDMVLGALDIREALSGQAKEGLADKIFKMVESVAPQILQIAAMSAQARMNNPMVKATKGYVESDPDFQALKKNPDEMRAFCERMDSTFGWEQTDTILTTVGWQRTAESPRDPSQQYPAGDPRNGNGNSVEDVETSGGTSL